MEMNWGVQRGGARGRGSSQTDDNSAAPRLVAATGTGGGLTSSPGGPAPMAALSASDEQPRGGEGLGEEGAAEGVSADCPRRAAAATRSTGGAGAEGSYGPVKGAAGRGRGGAPGKTATRSSGGAGLEGSYGPVEAVSAAEATPAAQQLQRSPAAAIMPPGDASNAAAALAARARDTLTGFTTRVLAPEARPLASPPLAPAAAGPDGGSPVGLAESDLSALARALPPSPATATAGGLFETAEGEFGEPGERQEGPAERTAESSVEAMQRARAARAEAAAAEIREEEARRGLVSLAEMEDSPGLAAAVARAFGRGDGAGPQRGVMRSLL